MIIEYGKLPMFHRDYPGCFDMGPLQLSGVYPVVGQTPWTLITLRLAAVAILHILFVGLIQS